MNAPIAPIEATIEIEAPPTAVWALIADQRRMNEWSPELLWQKFSSDDVAAGTRSINLNKRKGFVWPTFSKITEFVPEKKLAFYVMGPGAFWSYELEPTASGTKVTERRELKGGKRTLASKVTASAALGGIAEHDAELIAGMNTTLERIKAEVESSVV